MDKEQLVAMGLTNEQVDKVIKAHKKDLDGKYVPKERFNAVNEQVKTANQTIEDRDNQIEKLKAFEGTNEELQKEITKLQGENATEKKKHQEMVEVAIKRARHVALIPYIVDRKEVITNPFEGL